MDVVGCGKQCWLRLELLVCAVRIKYGVLVVSEEKVFTIVT
jgi:hypothetical protein